MRGRCVQNESARVSLLAGRMVVVCGVLLFTGEAAASLDPLPAEHELLDVYTEQCGMTTARYITSSPDCIATAARGAVSLRSSVETSRGAEAGSRVELTWDGPSNRLLAAVTSRVDSGPFAEAEDDAIAESLREQIVDTMQRPQVTSGEQGLDEFSVRVEWYCENGNVEMAEYVSRDRIYMVDRKLSSRTFTVAFGLLEFAEDASEDARDRSGKNP